MALNAFEALERRRLELHALKSSNPAQLIAIYRHFSGLDECQQLARHVAFAAMIETILDVQEQERQFVAEHTENRNMHCIDVS